MFAVNSTGRILMSQAALQVLRVGAQQRGEGDVGDREHHVGGGAHHDFEQSASAGALQRVEGCLLQLTLARALGCAPDRVWVNVVTPGFIEAPPTKRTFGNAEPKNWLLDRTSVGRVAQPEDLASAASFLGSAKASWITGATLFVDGGWTVS
ncbi:MAG: SDR family NAD(P)-dependent oxidoreductase [Mycobacterium sp.]